MGLVTTLTPKLALYHTRRGTSITIICISIITAMFEQNSITTDLFTSLALHLKTKSMFADTTIIHKHEIIDKVAGLTLNYITYHNWCEAANNIVANIVI